MNWVLILLVIVAILAISKLIHLNALKHKIVVIILFILLVLFIMTFVSVANSSSVSLKNPSGLLQAGKVYFSWLGHIFDNARVLTGNAVRMNWFGNSTG